MTPDQCRAAREHRNWTRDELRKAADVPMWFVAAFEDGKATPDFLAGYEVDLREALESAGVESIAENRDEAGVRLRKE
jgi:ribosome-binding protein aMBF1 (putative translation factor)